MKDSNIMEKLKAYPKFSLGQKIFYQINSVSEPEKGIIREVSVNFKDCYKEGAYNISYLVEPEDMVGYEHDDYIHIPECHCGSDSYPQIRQVFNLEGYNETVNTYKLIAPTGEILHLSYEETVDLFVLCRDTKRKLQTLNWENILPFWNVAIPITDY